MVQQTLPIELPLAELGELCRRYQVRELSLFGSALRDDFRPDSDLDLLVEFAPEARVTLITLGQLEAELEALVGRQVDLGPKSGLKPVIRDKVLASTRMIYAEGAFSIASSPRHEIRLVSAAAGDDGPSRHNREQLYLIEMRDAAEAIRRFIGPRSYDEFLRAEMLQRAVLLQLTIIGEAAFRLTPQFRRRHRQETWTGCEW